MLDYKINEYIEKIDSLSVGLLVSARAKEVDKKAFDDLYRIFDDILFDLKENIFINRKLTGRIFFIYTQLRDQVNYVKYPHPLILECAKVEEYLDKIVQTPF